MNITYTSIAKYQCEFCKKEYASQREAERCESDCFRADQMKGLAIPKVYIAGIGNAYYHADPQKFTKWLSLTEVYGWYGIKGNWEGAGWYYIDYHDEDTCPEAWLVNNEIRRMQAEASELNRQANEAIAFLQANPEGIKE